MDQLNQRESIVLQALDSFELPLLRYALRLLNGKEELARDVVQHTFMKLCETPPCKIQDRLGPWLFTVCRNKAMDFLRRATREPGTVEENVLISREPGPEVSMERKALIQQIEKIIKQLPDAVREVAELWAQGFSNAEIAEIIDQPAGTVRVRLHRAIQRLRSNSHIKTWFNTREPKAVPTSTSRL